MDKMAVPLSPNISLSAYQLTTVSLTYIITHMTSSSHSLSSGLSFFSLLCSAGIYADAYDNAMGYSSCEERGIKGGEVWGSCKSDTSTWKPGDYRVHERPRNQSNSGCTAHCRAVVLTYCHWQNIYCFSGVYKQKTWTGKDK